MSEQKSRKFRRIEAAHERFTGVMLAVGMPPRFRNRTIVGNINWYDNAYRERVGNFYIDSFASTPRPSVKTVKKFVRGYMRWLRRQTEDKAREYDESTHASSEV